MTKHTGTRIKERREQLAISMSELARQVGIAPQSVQQWEIGRTSPKGQRLEILAGILRCSKEWLMFGDSQPGFDSVSTDVEVPVLDVELSAGHGSYNDSDTILETAPVPLRLLERFNVDPGSARIVKVKGDSMESTLRSGEEVIVDTADKKLISNNIYAFEFDGEMKVKRFIKQFDSTWTIRSDNKHDPAYQDQTVAPHNISQLRIIGRVAGLLGRMF